MPTEQDHTLDQLNILFQIMIMNILGLLHGSPIDYLTPAKAVRVSWPTDGAPAWGITEDIVFLRTTEDDDPINRQRESKYSNKDGQSLNDEVSYTRVISLNLVFYGPNSFKNAQIVRDGVFQDNYRRLLAKDKIYLIPDIPSPQRAPELFQGKWWERTDLELRFNEKIIKVNEIGNIDSVEIIVQNKIGIVADITIEQGI